MDKPNIIYIMADDMGYGDLVCYNPQSHIPTPNMDNVANEGIRFADVHAPSAVCTPTRYGFLTGRYAWRTTLKRGVLGGYDLPLISEDRLTLPSMLKKIGYHTACIGKWHLGLKYQTIEGENLDLTRLPRLGLELESKIDFEKPVTGGPLERGFDYFFGTATSSTCHPPYGFIENNRFTDPPSVYHEDPLYTSRPGMMSPGWEHKDVDTTFIDKAVEYIERKARQEKPFFLYLAPSAPHEPCAQSVVPEFARGKSKAGPRGDLVWLFDWMVGKILKALENTDIVANTMLIITSDNGALPGDRVLNNNGNIILDEDGEEYYRTYGHKSCYNWRGYKAHIWEGGHRVPLLIKYPGKIKLGSVNNQLICLTDFIATFADLVNYNLPQEAAEDSISFLPAMFENYNHHVKRQILIHHSGEGVFSIRKGHWKYIHETTGSGGWPPPKGNGPEEGNPGQLYNILEDTGEENNLFYKHPQIANELKALLKDIMTKGTGPTQIINN